MEEKKTEAWIDINKVLFRYLRNWYWFLFFLILAVGGGFMVNRYTVPVYNVGASIFVNEDRNDYNPFSSQTGGSMFEGFGIMPQYQGLSNQILLLRSRTLVERALKRLDFTVSYYTVGNIMSRETYDYRPFYIVWDQENPQLLDIDFRIHIMPDGKIEVSAEGENVKVYNYSTHQFVKTLPLVQFSKVIDAGTRLVANEFSFTIYLNENFNPAQNTFTFRFNHPEALVNKYLNNLSIARNSNAYGILDMRLKEENVSKGILFLNELIKVYQENNLEKKNLYASNTIDFIQRQLSVISDSLAESENEMISFQTRNKMMDASARGQQLSAQISELEAKKVELTNRIKYYQYLVNAVEDESLEALISPAAMGLSDQVINNMIMEFNKAKMEKTTVLTSIKNPEHPRLRTVNSKLESISSGLKTNLSTLISQANSALSDLQRSISRMESQVSNLPKTERDFISLERNFNMNNATFTFLMQRLSEAQIARASNTSDYELIENPRQIGGSIEPNKKKNYTYAIFLGLLIPALIIFLRVALNKKVQSQEEVESMTDFPVIGHVFRNVREFASRTLVLDKPNSPASEPYRAIRNKLNLMTKGNENPVISVTSTFPKEGKTYTTINVASSYALMGKKTVVLDLDLRNSKILEEFNLKSHLGVVNYIIGKAGIEDILFETKHPNLKIIPAGPIPPNPSEMLTDNRMTELIRMLKAEFDVIVIDSPPVGFVADIFQLYDQIDANLYIIRHKFTHKLGLKIALEEVKKQQLKGLGLIINDINRGRRNYGYGHGYGYGYGYGYSYGYGYGNDKSSKKSKRKRLSEEDLTENA